MAAAPSHVGRSCKLPADADLTLLSWNVLAPAWADPVRYAHVAHEAASVLCWEARLPRIVEEIERSAPDVICLQEVEFALFEEDIMPALVSLGYFGVMQNDPKRASDHPAGNATFWRDDAFSLKSESSRSRTLTTVLSDASKRSIAVVNCHLEGDPRQAVTRVKQLQSALKQAAAVDHHALIVAGDFNCDLRSSASAAYLAFGSVPLGVQEWGHDVPAAAGDVPGHGYALSSAYGPELADEFSFTIRGSSVWFLDQLWFTPSALEVLATRSTVDGPEHRSAILASGLPSARDPSDHLPIAAGFRWSTASLANLAASKQEPAAPVQAADLEQEAAELLAACPISDAQRAEWLRVTAPPPALPKKQKPSPEQLAALKELQREKEALLVAVGEDAKAMLLRVQQLTKKARKA